MLTTQCCFCGRGIDAAGEDGRDPCALVLVPHWDSSRGPHDEPQFYCHFACFTSSLDPETAMLIRESSAE